MFSLILNDAKKSFKHCRSSFSWTKKMRKREEFVFPHLSWAINQVKHRTIAFWRGNHLVSKNCECVCVFACVCVRACACVCVLARVNVRERERERKRDRVREVIFRTVDAWEFLLEAATDKIFWWGQKNPNLGEKIRRKGIFPWKPERWYCL